MRASAYHCLGLILATFVTAAMADDWPQWMGPRRNNVWNESGILKSVPESGLKVLWRTKIQGGYSGPAVANGRVFVTDFVRTQGKSVNDPNARTKVLGRERVLCLSEKTGEILWEYAYDCPYEISYPAGPRCTPTVADGRVYALGAEGHLHCFDAARGIVLWKKHLPSEYDAEVPMWGYSGHPLVYQNLLITLAGGEGSTVVAFDKVTGEERWRALSAEMPGYCPPTIVQAAGIDQLLIWDPEHLHALNPLTGKAYWSVDLKPSYGMSITAPQQQGDMLFVTGIGPVGGLYRLQEQSPGLTPVWKATTKSGVSCVNSTPFLDGDVIYGVDCKSGGLRAVDLRSAEWLWETYEPTTGDHRRGNGTGFLVKNGDQYVIFSETGDLVLASLSREKYEEHGRFHVLKPTHEVFGRSVVWSAPAYANGCCFARNDDEIVCVSLRSPDWTRQNAEPAGMK